MTINLEFLPQTAFVFILLFARIGVIITVLPGVGDRSVPVRMRLVFALALVLVMMPVLQDKLPPMPTSVSGMVTSLLGELLLGMAIGFSIRILITALIVTGEIIALQTGLAFAQSVDPSQGVQGTLVANFLSLLSVTLIFAADLHHIFIGAIHDSYSLFPVGLAFPGGDFAQLSIRAMGEAFRIAVQLSSPFLVFGLVFYFGVGILSRLIPQVQVFFVIQPATIYLGFIILMLLLSTLMFWYLDYFQNSLKPYIQS
ncbi:MAG: flagellar biosynthetic protein FliR [Pseudomonadota bacterium]